MFPTATPNPFQYSLLNITYSSSSSSSFPSHPQNPTPTQPPPPLLFNFPSPFLDEHESPLNQIFFQSPSPHDHQRISNLCNSKVEKMDDQIIKPNIAAVEAPPRRRRVGKKDRHSKICTAQGIRDRRMRLSLQVARKFFDLQDMLGYDKASKTIEWLFTQSKKAIKELVDDHQSPPILNNASNSGSSFVSECEDLSGSIEEINSNNNVVLTPSSATAKPSSTTRESREKARARARCRTREKMLVKRLRFSEDIFKPNPNNNHIISIPFEEEIRVSTYTSSLEQQLSDVAMIDKFLGNSSSFSGSAAAVPDAGGGALVGFMNGNWDVMSNNNIERWNRLQYAAANNEVSFAGNYLNSVHSATAEFP